MATKISFILVFQSSKCFCCIPYEWKHTSRHQDRWSTPCTGWAMPCWRKLYNGGQDGGHYIFLLVFHSSRCIGCIPCPWKYINRHQARWQAYTSCTGWATQTWRKFHNGSQDGGHYNFLLVFQSSRCLGCITCPWKHTSKHQDRWSTSCTGCAILFWELHSGGQDGSQHDAPRFSISFHPFLRKKLKLNVLYFTAPVCIAWAWTITVGVILPTRSPKAFLQIRLTQKG